MRTTDGGRRKRVHHAAATRVLSGGLTASATLGIVAALAANPASSALSTPSPEPQRPGASPAAVSTTPAAPRRIVRIVRRHLAPRVISAPPAAIPSRSVPRSIRSSPTRVARQPAAAPPAAAPTPVTRSNGSR